MLSLSLSLFLSLSLSVFRLMFPRPHYCCKSPTYLEGLRSKLPAALVIIFSGPKFWAREGNGIDTATLLAFLLFSASWEGIGESKAFVLHECGVPTQAGRFTGAAAPHFYDQHVPSLLYFSCSAQDAFVPLPRRSQIWRSRSRIDSQRRQTGHFRLRSQPQPGTNTVASLRLPLPPAPTSLPPSRAPPPRATFGPCRRPPCCGSSRAAACTASPGRSAAPSGRPGAGKQTVRARPTSASRSAAPVRRCVSAWPRRRQRRPDWCGLRTGCRARAAARRRSAACAGSPGPASGG
mmetsp:Transcript_9896/g.27817  ORF Transcript_9896/g.27817 Transcript_9896/m.27817 type:complete len:292 (-) Transcript_9896:169-1044(-)